MILEDNFYFLDSLNYEAGTLSAEATISAMHYIYAGHFPSGAVVPGVCTLTIVRECLSRAMGREVSFEAIKECKFVSALIPQEDLRICMEFTVADSGQLRGTVTTPTPDGEQVVLKLKATLRR